MSNTAVSAPPVTNEEWRAHIERVNLVTGVMAGILTALSTQPMFAGFIPPDLREQIKALS